MFPRVQLTIFQHWSRWWLGADQATSHYLNQWWLGYWRICASLGLSELMVNSPVNSSPPEENGRYLTDDIFKCIFMNEKFRILIEISLNFVPEGSVDNKWALFQVMAWRRIGDKPLPEPMLTPFTRRIYWALWGDELKDSWNSVVLYKNWHLDCTTSSKALRSRLVITFL